MQANSDRPAGLATWLGYLGLAPFIGALAGMYLAEAEARELATRGFIAWGAVILTFAGAVHWGCAVTATGPARGNWYLASVLPALLAWLALLAEPAASLLTLLVGFVTTHLYERLALWRRVLPPWYRRLRSRLTVLVGICLVAALVANLS